MEEVKQIALNKALKTLDAIGCKYCVIDPENKKYGDLEVASSKSKGRSKMAFPRGTVIEHMRPLIGDLKPGEVGAVSCDRFGKINTSKYISSMAVRWWGKGNATVSYVKDKNEVQVLRVA